MDSSAHKQASTAGPKAEKFFENRRDDEVGETIAPSTEWLNSEQAALYLGISVGSLNNMASNGFIPFYKLGRRNRYLLSELRSLLLATKRGGSR